ncbi:MAG: quinohemoprotein ethanol dehydrogenase [Limisphaerales bacterium]|jgi:quinohemoprotein ethanol dehydrogenase
MKIIKSLALILGLGLLVAIWVAPIGPMPGIFIGGTPSAVPQTWGDTNPVHEISLSVGTGMLPRVVIIWVVQFEGDLYVVGSPDSGWTQRIGAASAVQMRLGDETYDMHATRVEAGWKPILTAYAEKYEPDYPEIVGGFPNLDDAQGMFAIFRLTGQAQQDSAKSTPSANAVSDKRLRQAEQESANWLTHGRTYDEQRHSPLEQINKETIGDLGLAWSWDTGTTRGLEATPIVVDGIMYTSGTWSVVYAHDAKTGAHLWTYDPQVDREYGWNACCDVVNRGVAVWGDMVYVGALDGRLIAIDASDGSLRWQQQTTDLSKPYTITGAPRVVKGKVIIGNGGAELGVRGYVTAYDAATGAEQWRFYTVPGNPAEPFEHPELAEAAKTWRGGKWWEVGGGGTVWDAMAYDAELNLLYIGVGNGAPWSRYTRSPGGGDNLYLASIVALNPDDGRLAWHYQTTPGDNWDYTAVQQMILADLEIAGEMRQVIMQAPKNGFFYVLDRATGEYISAEAYVPITWATHIDPETGRPVEHPSSHFLDQEREVHPGPAGGHNWHPMSYSPETELVYMPTTDNRMVYAQERNFEYDRDSWNTAIDFKYNETLDDGYVVTTKLVAWDPKTQSPRWSVDHERPGASGVLSTRGGLVFQTGSNCTFSAYDAEDGELLWQTQTQMNTIAAPISYAVDGEQYVAFMAGWGGAVGLYERVPCEEKIADTGRILVYKLGGQEQLPPAKGLPPVHQPPARLTADTAVIEKGQDLWRKHCGFCHSLGPADGGVVPNLAHISSETHAAWDAIVLGGARRNKGMISFAHVLDQDDARALQSFVIDTAHTAWVDRQALNEATSE